MNKPNIFRHMIRWGFYGGGLLALFVLLIHTMNTFMITIPLIIFHPLIWIFAVIFGCLPGILIGLLNAAALDFFLSNTSTSPMNQSLRYKLFTLVFVLTSLGGLGMTKLLWDYADLQSLSYITLLAPVLAIAAVQHYLQQLRLYYEHNHKQKRKAHYDVSRLLDNLGTHSDDLIPIESLQEARRRLRR